MRLALRILRPHSLTLTLTVSLSHCLTVSLSLISLISFSSLSSLSPLSLSLSPLCLSSFRLSSLSSLAGGSGQRATCKGLFTPASKKSAVFFPTSLPSTFPFSSASFRPPLGLKSEYAEFQPLAKDDLCTPRTCKKEIWSSIPCAGGCPFKHFVLRNMVRITWVIVESCVERKRSFGKFFYVCQKQLISWRLNGQRCAKLGMELDERVCEILTKRALQSTLVEACSVDLTQKNQLVKKTWRKLTLIVPVCL